MKQGQIFSELPGEQEILAHELSRLNAHHVAQLLMVQQKTDTMGRSFRGIDQKAGVIIHQL